MVFKCFRLISVDKIVYWGNPRKLLMSSYYSKVRVFGGLILQANTSDLLIQVFFLTGEKPLPLKTSLQKKRSFGSAFSAPSAVRLQESWSPTASIDPKADHNYSANSVAAQRCASRASMPSLSSVDEAYEFIPKSSHGWSDVAKASTVKSRQMRRMRRILWETVATHRTAPQAHGDSTLKGQPGKKIPKQSCQEIDEDLKETARSLLHLAGIRTCLGSLISTAKAQSQKHREK